MSDIATLVSHNLDLWTSAIERKAGAGRGDGKKISLYGIERLRAMIFELAALGQLVENDGSKPIKLGPNVELVMGQAPPGSACNKDGVGTIFVKTGEFGDLYPDIREWTTKPLKHARLGDVLICVVGATIGKLNLGIDCAIGRSVAAIRPKKGLDTKYLYYALMPFTLRLRRDARGSAQGVIGKSELSGVQIRIPSLAEQRRIVAKVDELMALCDTLEAESTAALEAHQALVESFLSTLVNSADATDLATNWVRLETLFDTLFTTEASIDALKQTTIQLAVKGKLIGFRRNWRTSPLGDFVVDAAAGWSPKCIEAPRSGDKWGVLKVSAVTWGRFQPEENKELPPNLDPRPEAEVKPGDFLISRANTADLVARSVVVPHGAPSRLMMSDKIIRFRFNGDLTPEYVNLIHASPDVRAYYARVAGGTSSSMKNVSQAQIRALSIQVPTLAEQRRIVAKVDEIMALCDAMKARFAEAVETQKHLADAIVQRAAA